MAGMSDYLEGKVLEHTLDIASYTAPTAVYLALYTTAPTDAGGGTEVSGNAYARQAVTFERTGNVASNASQISFPSPTGSWGTVVAFGIFDALTTGNLLYWDNLDNSQTVSEGNEVFFVEGALTVTAD